MKAESGRRNTSYDGNLCSQHLKLLYGFNFTHTYFATFSLVLIQMETHSMAKLLINAETHH